MFLRLLFVLLVALNIAAGAWLLLGQDGPRVRPATDPGVPLLHLSAERAPQPAAAAPSPAKTAATAVSAMPPAPLPAASASAGAAGPALAASAGNGAASPAVAATGSPAPAGPASASLTAPSSSPVAATTAPAAAAPAREPAAVPPRPRPASYTCLALGPFADEAELRRARGLLATQAVRSRSRQEQATQARGWWVYLPAQRSRDQALAEARRLGERGIKDYFVVGASGQPNTISLGLFKDPANARKRRDEVVQAGFPAQLVERTDTVPAYWLDLVVADGTRLDWRGRVHGENLALRATGCF